MTIPKLELLTRQALSICEQLERGQAETPLADEVQQLHSDMQQHPLTVVLLGLTSDSIEKVLAWLCGDVFKQFSIEGRQWPGYMEVKLGSHGYAFASQNSQRREFEAQEAFLQALQIELGATKASIANPLYVQTQSSRGVDGLTLLIPDSPAALLDSPALLNAIVAQTNLAMVAAPLRYTLSREDHEAVEVLTSNMRGFWPLLTVDELAEEIALPAVGWWEQHQQTSLTLEPKLLTRHVEASLPGLLVDSNDPQRKAFIEAFFSHKFAGKLNAIFERYQQQAGVLEQRKQRINKAAVVQSGLDRRELDKLRQQLDEVMQQARRDLDSQIQEMSTPLSPISKAVAEAISNLQFDHLTVEESHSILKLSLNDHTLADLRQLIFKQAKLAVKRYHQRCQQQLDAARDITNQQLQALAMPELPATELADRADIYNALDKRLQLNLNYRGEMPKRTFMTRLGESRKVIMALSLGTMVLGGVAKALYGIDLRSSVMTLAPILLLGGFIYTYIQWPKEDAEKLEKELDKVRDGLTSEMRRTISEVQRFVQQQFQDLCNDQKRDYQKTLQETLQSHQDELQRQTERERQKQQQNLQQIDQELRQWQGIERQLERLRGDALQLSRECA